MKTYVLFLPTDISIVYYVVPSIQMKTYALFVGGNSTYVFIWIEETTQ
jgi:hypothetical protein